MTRRGPGSTPGHSAADLRDDCFDGTPASELWDAMQRAYLRGDDEIAEGFAARARAAEALEEAKRVNPVLAKPTIGFFRRQRAT